GKVLLLQRGRRPVGDRGDPRQADLHGLRALRRGGAHEGGGRHARKQQSHHAHEHSSGDGVDRFVTLGRSLRERLPHGTAPGKRRIGAGQSMIPDCYGEASSSTRPLVSTANNPVTTAATAATAPNSRN